MDFGKMCESALGAVVLPQKWQGDPEATPPSDIETFFKVLAQAPCAEVLPTL
jgi:hypothetical protein